MSLTYLVPTLGRARYLTWALRSLEAQTEPWCIIGYDNGSTDDSSRLLRDFCEAHGGRYIRSDIFADDGGHASGTALLEAWNGDGLAAYLHDDDMCHPDRTRRLLDEADGCDLIMTAMWPFRDGQEPLALAGSPTAKTVWGCDPSRWGNGIHDVVGNTTTPTAMLTARYLEVPQSTGYVSGAQDTLTWLRAARLGLKIGYIDEPLYYYRLHPQQSSATFYSRVPDFNEEVARIHQEAEES